MDRAIRWTEIAWQDLDQAAQYIAIDSPSYAANFVREVRDSSRTLAQFPHRGRIVPEWDHPSVREMIVKRYRLIYRVTHDAVEILALIHGARDLAALWEREERSSS